MVTASVADRFLDIVYLILKCMGAIVTLIETLITDIEGLNLYNTCEHHITKVYKDWS